MAIILGNLEDEYLEGFAESDSIIGDAHGKPGTYKGGDDILNGLGESDELYGDRFDMGIAGSLVRGGHDILYGGEGKDWLYGDAFNMSGKATGGNDILYGGPGDEHHYLADRVYGIHGDAFNMYDESHGGKDELYGDEGNDSLFGDAREMWDRARGANDRLYGNSGDDLLYGDADWMHDATRGGNDDLFGGEGRDSLLGDSWDFSNSSSVKGGNDELYGDAGDDWLVGDARARFSTEAKGGSDVLIGGTGNDILFGCISTGSLFDPSSWDGGVRAKDGKDRLTGVDPDAAEPGRGEFDQLIGGGNRDRFYLGDQAHAYYVGEGFGDFALLRDFTPSEGDRIYLKANAMYHLEEVNFSLGGETISGTGIFVDQLGTQTFSNELIGVLEGVPMAGISLGAYCFKRI